MTVPFVVHERFCTGHEVAPLRDEVVWENVAGRMVRYLVACVNCGSAAQEEKFVPFAVAEDDE